MPLIECENEIHAPIEVVWDHLTAIDHYSEWNPFVIRIEAAVPAKIGTNMLLHIRWPKGGGAKSPETVTVLEPPTPNRDGIVTARFEYCYAGLLARLGLVQGTRIQTLEQKPNSPVHYRSKEHFTGALCFALPIKNIRQGFDAQAQALKTHAERSPR